MSFWRQNFKNYCHIFSHIAHKNMQAAVLLFIT